MSRDKKVKVGQSVWIKNTRRNSTTLVEAKVQKVGRKYFTVERLEEWIPADLQFDIETLQEKADYRGSSNSTVFLTLQDYEDSIELSNKRLKIARLFSNWSSPSWDLKKTRKVYDAIFLDEDTACSLLRELQDVALEKGIPCELDDRIENFFGRQ